MLRKATRRLFTKIIEQETLIFPRTIETIKVPEAVTKTDAAVSAEVETSDDTIDDWATLGDTWRARNKMPTENGFTYKGNEPTMFGDWQHKGRATDF